jgi:putative tricarboxylic transport membrane protein
MYDLISNLAMGFGVAATPTNVMLCMIGALVGTLIGVLPGIGSLATIAMLLPITFGLHLLRRSVRRLDNVDPGQHPG